MFDKYAGLNTSKGKYSIIIIAPHAGNRKWLVLTLIMQAMSDLHQIFTCLVKSPDMKTSKGQYSVYNYSAHLLATDTSCFALTETYHVQYAPNFTCLVRVLAWKHLHVNVSVIGIAPTSWQQEVGTNKWLWHIPPIFTILRPYCPPFAVFLKPPVGGEPGCEVPSHHRCLQL